MRPDDALVGGSLYFFAGLGAPFGMLGTREWAVGIAGFLPGGLSADEFLLAALVVTAAEAITSIPLTIIGVAWLRPGRAIRRQPE